jgi:hypothetical protein
LSADDVKSVDNMQQLPELSLQCPKCDGTDVALGKRDRKTAKIILGGASEASETEPAEES